MLLYCIYDNNDNNNDRLNNMIYKAPYGRNVRGAGGSGIRSDVLAYTENHI